MNKIIECSIEQDIIKDPFANHGIEAFINGDGALSLEMVGHGRSITMSLEALREIYNIFCSGRV